MAILVVNQKHIRNAKPEGTICYVGRPHKEFNYQRSPLANEWSHLPNSRARHHVEKIEDAITCYHQWLLNEVKNTRSAAFRELERFAEIAEQGTLVIVCWCLDASGNGECHGLVIRRAVEWRMRERSKSKSQSPAAGSADNHIFVFGSNLAGRHGKGAALDARNHHGAIYGQGIGLQGRSYAIPTKDRNIRTLPLTEIARHVSDFIAFAREHQDLTFNVTRIGCGHAGYTDPQIAPMFKGAPDNCQLPEGWSEIIAASE
jgi:hypothetical protein